MRRCIATLVLTLSVALGHANAAEPSAHAAQPEGAAAVGVKGDATQPPEAPATATKTATAPAAAVPAPVPAVRKKPVAVPARELFGSVKVPASLQARAIGTYAKGCLAGAEAMPIDGSNWQAMRLSRNRNWGHPKLIALLKRFAGDAAQLDGWPGLLIGDIAQPRGGPMLTGHASHQVGLDADIWLTPMPDHRLTEKEREEINATSMLAADEISVNPAVWTSEHVKIIKRAAGYPEVERILVHPAIKKALCNATTTAERAWLSKVRPYWGHYYHMHVRIGCPAGSPGCTPQPAAPHDDGCGKELTDWIKLVTPKPPAPPSPPTTAQPAKPAPGKPSITLDQLPSECRVVLTQGEPGIPKKLIEAQKKSDAGVATVVKRAAPAPSATPAAAKPAVPVEPITASQN